MGLSRAEQETIINFNKQDRTAWVFTYEKTYQSYYERKGFKPILDNGRGGKEYVVPKSFVLMPKDRTRGKLSPEHKKALVDGLLKSKKQGKNITTKGRI
jgi:hypothetical protein